MIKSVIGSLDVTPTGGHRPRQRWRQWSNDLLRRGQGALEMKNVVRCQQIHLLRWNRLFFRRAAGLALSAVRRSGRNRPRKTRGVCGGEACVGNEGGACVGIGAETKTLLAACVAFTVWLEKWVSVAKNAKHFFLPDLLSQHTGGWILVCISYNLPCKKQNRRQKLFNQGALRFCGGLTL